MKRAELEQAKPAELGEDFGGMTKDTLDRLNVLRAYWAAMSALAEEASQDGNDWSKEAQRELDCMKNRVQNWLDEWNSDVTGDGPQITACPKKDKTGIWADCWIYYAGTAQYCPHCTYTNKNEPPHRRFPVSESDAKFAIKESRGEA